MKAKSTALFFPARPYYMAEVKHSLHHISLLKAIRYLMKALHGIIQPGVACDSERAGRKRERERARDSSTEEGKKRHA